MSIAGWRHALRSEWPFIIIILMSIAIDTSVHSAFTHTYNTPKTLKP